jgi:hypothetical protein
MSDTILKIIPTDPEFLPEGPEFEDVPRVARQLFPQSTGIDLRFGPAIVFVDAGENWEGVACPHCGADLEDWWFGAMDVASNAEGFFDSLAIITPCCGHATSLNELNYGWPVGFARFHVDIVNPAASQLAPVAEMALAAAFRHDIRAIWAHV